MILSPLRWLTISTIDGSYDVRRLEIDKTRVIY